MSIVITPPISDYTINGHTYTNSDWEANPQSALSGTANDFAAIVALLPLFPNVIIHTSGTLNIHDPGYYCINKTVGSATSVVIDQSISGLVVVQDMKRDAATNNITITIASSGTINGQSSLVLTLDGAGVGMAWTGSDYRTVWSS